MKKIDSIGEFDQLIEEGKPFFFVKHSLTCPISHEAFNESKSFDADSDIPGYYLAVQESRELSNYIADKFNIKHESPQAFFIINGEAAWNASHWAITKSALNKAIEEVK